jgi:Lrp/AsnC family leucine-responsive transcriptional regulator
MMVNINDKYKLDEKDQKILKMLTEDSRLQWAEIGANLGISNTAARRRVLNLADSGVISRFTIDINYDLIEEE